MNKGLDFPDNLMSIFGFKRVEEDIHIPSCDLCGKLFNENDLKLSRLLYPSELREIGWEERRPSLVCNKCRETGNTGVSVSRRSKGQSKWKMKNK